MRWMTRVYVSLRERKYVVYSRCTTAYVISIQDTTLSSYHVSEWARNNGLVEHLFHALERGKEKQQSQDHGHGRMTRVQAHSLFLRAPPPLPSLSLSIWRVSKNVNFVFLFSFDCDIICHATNGDGSSHETVNDDQDESKNWRKTNEQRSSVV